MRYSVMIIRCFYNDKATIEKKQTQETFFDTIDSAVLCYRCSITGERVTGELHSSEGSSNIYVKLYARPDDGMTLLESTFLHNGEVQ